MGDILKQLCNILCTHYFDNPNFQLLWLCLSNFFIAILLVIALFHILEQNSRLITAKRIAFFITLVYLTIPSIFYLVIAKILFFPFNDWIKFLSLIFFFTNSILFFSFVFLLKDKKKVSTLLLIFVSAIIVICLMILVSPTLKIIKFFAGDPSLTVYMKAFFIGILFLIWMLFKLLREHLVRKVKNIFSIVFDDILLKFGFKHKKESLVTSKGLILVNREDKQVKIFMELLQKILLLNKSPWENFFISQLKFFNVYLTFFMSIINFLKVPFFFSFFIPYLKNKYVEYIIKKDLELLESLINLDLLESRGGDIDAIFCMVFARTMPKLGPFHELWIALKASQPHLEARSRLLMEEISNRKNVERAGKFATGVVLTGSALLAAEVNVRNISAVDVYGKRHSHSLIKPLIDCVKGKIDVKEAFERAMDFDYVNDQVNGAVEHKQAVESYLERKKYVERHNNSLAVKFSCAQPLPPVGAAPELSEFQRKR